MSDSSSEIQIHVKGAKELKLQITINTEKTVQELKQVIAEKTDAPADRQRLIYSGKVLKDEELLSIYKIQSGHTIHMVKSAARPGANSSTSGAPPPLPPMQAGQNLHDPLTQLNSHLGFGAMAGLNPFPGMGVNPNDPNMMQNMLNSPEFIEQMSTMLADPRVLEQIAAIDPRIRGLSPQMLQAFRQMVSNPGNLRAMLQMSSQMTQGGPPANADPLAALRGGSGGFGGAPNLPTFPNLFANPANPAQTTDATNTQSTTGSLPQTPPLDPAMMQLLMNVWGGQGAAGEGLGGGPFDTPATPAPADTRPPEERFQEQLLQLNEMGFHNPSQNIRALQATGGNVHTAVDYILNGGGLAL